jgi:hypothetical protein
VSEFADRPFAAGSLTGVRSFRVTADGMLTGVVHRGVWQPGVNEAVCTRGTAPWQAFAAIAQSGVCSMAQMSWAFESMGAQTRGEVFLKKRPKSPPPPAPPAPPTRPEHQTGTLDCTCGFYAYFDDGHNPHHDSGNLLGIVEGFGVCTVGSRGFRSSKARLRALVDTIWSERKLDVVRANYPDVPIFPTLAAALSEFPLTPVESPEPKVTITTSGYTLPTSVTYTMTVDMSGITNALSRAYRSLSKSMKTPSAPTDESPRDRALRLRRERNTGPSDRLGLDGHLRRRTAR